jgi:hypothetical protein
MKFYLLLAPCRSVQTIRALGKLFLTLDQGGMGICPRFNTLVVNALTVADCPSLSLTWQDLRRSLKECGFQRLHADCEIIDGELQISGRPCSGLLPPEEFFEVLIVLDLVHYDGFDICGELLELLLDRSQSEG